MKHRFIALAASATLLATTAGQALAFDCVVANKPPAAGAVGTIDASTGAFTPLKSNPGSEEQPHGAFIVIQGLPTGTASTFVHAPTNAQAPLAEPGVIPGATVQESKGKGCDSKGLDTIESCLGV